jgi:hypothetical protein
MIVYFCIELLCSFLNKCQFDISFMKDEFNAQDIQKWEFIPCSIHYKDQPVNPLEANNRCWFEKNMKYITTLRLSTRYA